MPYVIYRAVVAIYFCVMTVYNVLTFPSQAKWIVYMSHWSYSVITVSTLLQAIYATRHYRICKERGYDNGERLGADFDWPIRFTRVSLPWYTVYGNLHCARIATRVIQQNSDDRDPGDKPLM